MTNKDINDGKDLGQQVQDLANELKVDLKVSGAQLGEYIAQRVSHLRFAAKEAGYAEALKAEQDAILLYATGVTVDEADKVDGKLVQLLVGGLTALVAAA